MDKKYQIFVSSTYNDLKDERDQAIKAILEMGHIPVGMEMFSAGDEEQWQLIARQIEETDYYVIIVGHRYGSETQEGISYTEKEYDYAKSLGIPTLGFVIDDSASWPSNRIDDDPDKIMKLKKFKKKVKTKLIQFWTNKDDLHGKISISLIKTMNTNPRIGWTRANQSIGANVTKELTRLSAENSILREELEKIKSLQREQVDEVRDVVNILNNNLKNIKVKPRGVNNYEDAEVYEKTLLQIFLATAPNMIHENSSVEIANNIALAFHGVDYNTFWPVARNVTTSIIADLVALDLTEPSKKKHAVSDENTYWSLTKLGKQVLKRHRRIQLEEGIETENNISDTENEE